MLQVQLLVVKRKVKGVAFSSEKHEAFQVLRLFTIFPGMQVDQCNTNFDGFW